MLFFYQNLYVIANLSKLCNLTIIKIKYYILVSLSLICLSYYLLITFTICDIFTFNFSYLYYLPILYLSTFDFPQHKT